jgi:SNF2 family DNA or RNA helicase
MIPQFRRLREGFGPRRTKPEVFPNLLEPIYEDIYIELNPIQRTMYEQIKHELMLLDQKDEPLHSPNVLSQLQRMRQISVATPDVVSDEYDERHDRRVVKIRLIEPSAKLDALMEVIEGLEWDDEDKQQIVVFSNFVDPLELLQKRLDKAGIRWIRLLPGDNDSERYRKWAVEFPKKNHQVFLSTIKLGGESIDLTPASYVALLDLDWAPQNNNQAIERVWRPGFDTSRGAPIVIRFFAEDTVDQRMLETNETKEKWFDTIFGREVIISE